MDVAVHPFGGGERAADGSARQRDSESLHGEDGEPVDLYGHLRCDFLDTIIPTDRMRAGVVPYAENVVVSDEEAGGQWLSSGDEGWASDSDEDMEDW